MKLLQPKTEGNGVWWTMLIAALAAFAAAFTLSVEKIHLLQNPDAILSCSVNLVLNCASVMQTWQASVFGFPNSYIGIAGFAIVIAVAMGGLLRVKYSRNYLVTAQVFYGLGLIFAYWLFFQSVYVIQILCPWCLVVTFTTTLIFESLLHYNLRQNNFGLSKANNKKVQTFLDKQFDRVIIAAWIVLMVLLVMLKFGEGLWS
ncbi:MAG TPA: vitamin K epoxide reductase family protein [Candidatus Saccharimonadales bacterium]